MKLINFIILLCIFATNSAFSQVTQLNTTPLGTVGPFIGWNGTGFPQSLDIKTEFPDRINFYTLAGLASFDNLRMTIFDSSSFPYNQGFIGMGINLPRLRLEVANNIGLIPDIWDEGYHIDSIPVLRSWPLGGKHE